MKDKIFKSMVKNEVEKRLKGNTPKSTLGLDNQITKEQFAKMSFSQQQELFNNNRELYTQLTQL